MSTFSELRQRAGLSVQEAADEVGCAISTAYRWEHGEVETPADAIKALEKIAGRTRRKASGFRFIDLFAGIGGIRLGFEAIGGRCVFTSEWNKYAQATYRANFHDGPDHVFAGDITEVDASDIPPHDVLVAGFPCQPFSIAGVSKKNALGRAHGFSCDTQGTLFFDVARIIAHHRPPVFLLENVKNLTSHDKGRTFQVIRRTLEEELGYDVSWRVIDAKGLIPQHRERIFIVGVRGDLETPTDLSTLDLPDPATGPKLRTILHPEDGSEPADPAFLDDNGKVLEKYTLSDKLW
ncbi:MAG TPA: DNA (cytosine-5-)-methyltransferase, partial [Gammaproteobacteria bacterium]|nr:DNA (cytosine-5-)-methyltransferase [Gammaproteobacteria bacterium]